MELFPFPFGEAQHIRVGWRKATASAMQFTTTHWSLVLAAGDYDSEVARDALARLCTAYWVPVFAFVRRQGYPVEDAQDLTQAFFARVLEKNDFAAADRSRGRFRTFLLTACQHFLSNERDRERALKRGGGSVPLSIDAATAEARYASAMAHEETPERLYERQWAMALLASVLRELGGEFAASGSERLFERLSPFLTFDAGGDPYASVAEELGMTVGAVKVAVHRLRKRYRNLLRARVADTVAAKEEVDDEIRHLLQSLAT